MACKTQIDSLNYSRRHYTDKYRQLDMCRMDIGLTSTGVVLPSVGFNEGSVGPRIPEYILVCFGGDRLSKIPKCQPQTEKSQICS